jgi:hypothetical protein
MNCRRCGRKQSWPNFKVLSQNLTGEAKENHEKPQNSWSLDQDLNPRPDEYKADI